MTNGGDKPGKGCGKRRTTRRISIQKEVIINGSTRGEGLDLSETGMYVFTEAPFAPDTTIELRFTIAGEVIEASGTVAFAEPDTGIGVRFVNLSERSAEVVARYVNKRKDITRH